MGQGTGGSGSGDYGSGGHGTGGGMGQGTGGSGSGGSGSGGGTSFTSITTDTEGAQILVNGTLENNDGYVYLWDGSNRSNVTQIWSQDYGSGSYPEYLIYENDWGNSSDKREAYAANLSNNEYQVAIKESYTYQDYYSGQQNTDVNWQILTVPVSSTDNYQDVYGSNSGTDGIFESSITNYEYPYGDEIKRWETVFNLDLDGDNSVGEQAVSASDLYESLTDGSGVANTGNDDYLAFNSDPNSTLSWDTDTYILPSGGGDPIKIVDSGGYSVSLNDEWGDGLGRKAWAVEANSSGYLLTTKSKDNWGYGDEINWEVYQLTVQTNGGVTTAVYDWSPIYSSEDISSYEDKFNQDLNEDGTIGLNLSALGLQDKSSNNFNLRSSDNNGNDITVADTGDILATDNEGFLYIKKSSEWKLSLS